MCDCLLLLSNLGLIKFNVKLFEAKRRVLVEDHGFGEDPGRRRVDLSNQGFPSPYALIGAVLILTADFNLVLVVVF